MDQTANTTTLFGSIVTTTKPKPVKTGLDITIQHRDLLKCLATAFKIVSKNSPVMIMQCFLCESKDGDFHVSSISADSWMRANTGCMYSENGSFAVNARNLMDAMAGLSDGPIEITQTHNQVVFVQDKKKFSLFTMDPEDFPTFEPLKNPKELPINTSLFVDRLPKVAEFRAVDKTRLSLTGVWLKSDGVRTIIAGTNTHHCGWSYLGPIEELNLVLPVPLIGELTEDSEVLYDPSSLRFNLKRPGLEYGGALIDGTFPAKTEKVIEFTEAFSIVSGKEDLIQALKSVLHIKTNTDGFTPVMADLSASTMILSTNSVTFGESEVLVDCISSGAIPDAFKFKLNGEYFLRSVKTCADAGVRMLFVDNASPVRFEGADGKGISAVVLPMHVNS